MKNRNIILGAVLSALAWFGPLPAARAVVPAPDGGYANGNTAEGTQSLFSLTSGVWNTALGFQALNHDTVGGNNTATGFRALFSNTAGSYNTANGVLALYSNTNGKFNTANGANALYRNTSGTYNTASGYQALYRDTTGNGNTGSGYQALFSNQTGANNAAFGYTSLYNNTGSLNATFGSQTLVYNTTGLANTATGYQALVFNTTGDQNTATGYLSLHANTQSFGNTAFGSYTLFSNTGDHNTALGYAAGIDLVTGSNNIYICHSGFNAESNTIRIGRGSHTSTYIGGIAGQMVGAGGAACVVDNAGKLGVYLSARRFKTDIADMDNASEALLALRPVTFHYKPELDKTGIPQFGLIAEEVAKVNPDLVTHDAKGELSTVRYEAVNAMLLNEFLKEHRKNEEQEATIAQQQKQIEALTTGLQKVSAQLAAASPSSGGLETSKPAPQVVNNP
jgi:Chaperone of endosialidase